MQKALKHRRVKHYGFEFRYDNNNVDKDKPLPAGNLDLLLSNILYQVWFCGLFFVIWSSVTRQAYNKGKKEVAEEYVCF